MDEIISKDSYVQFLLFQLVTNFDKGSLDHKANFKIVYDCGQEEFEESALVQLLSIFNTVMVNYYGDHIEVICVITESDHMTNIISIFMNLYDRKLLNPFIMSFINLLDKQNTPSHGDDIYLLYKDNLDLDNLSLSSEEELFLRMLKVQVDFSRPYFMFYCHGFNEITLARDNLLAKLYFACKNILILSSNDSLDSLCLLLTRS
ncbi:hypothetical protein HZI73_25245 [Vallitalea pronyensis]|uniref:Uncharacterized protein n=1 Tax=Vallitalea pronyensis TaxID=1348613 RepID=A0A8J8MP41_9FIRM|nr:hypothetical protein [Vallitalea pronyensis]QUI25400.1 hypothetical protein HZI73_25245 [Vallitalea pronyensis]